MADDTDDSRKPGDSNKSEMILQEGKEAFQRCADAESENRNEALDDLRFARLGDQWPEKIRKMRELEGRPILTINRLPSFIRQVVNDARQNKPQINVRPVDDEADPDTAAIYSGLIRNIEHASSADVAYDTAADFAVSGGFGYIRVAIEYAHDDTFDRELRIQRVANPFTCFGDPLSTAADSSDWNTAFVTELLPRDTFKARYKGAEAVDWDDLGYNKLDAPWTEAGDVLVAEWWQREEVKREILLLSDGNVVPAEMFKENRELFAAMGVRVVESRDVLSHKVIHRIMTGAEILEENEWAGRYIPIIPVYGEEVNVEGKRHFRSLIRDAKDAQRMHNYWRTTSTETVALQPKAPFIGPEEAFQGDDAGKWATANTENHAFISYKGQVAPQRQPPAGIPAGAIQEALSSSDDMKSIMGMFDASLGRQSNETSGRAIIARQREGDTSTFHFPDNVARAIRHVGRVLIDLIPAVYTGKRIIRVLGQDGGNPTIVPVNQEVISRKRQDGTIEAYPADQADKMKGAKDAMVRVYDLGVGKYDLAVDTGPSFTTRREEAAMQMTELIRAFPQAAPVLGDQLAKNLDWPGADIISRRLKKMLPPGIAEPEPGEEPQGPPPPSPEQQAEQAKAKAEADKAQAELQIKRDELLLKRDELNFKRAESARNYDLQRAEAMSRGSPVGGVDDMGNIGPTPIDQMVQAMAAVAQQAQAAVALAQQVTAELQRMRTEPVQVTPIRRNGEIVAANTMQGGVAKQIIIQPAGNA